MERVIGPEPWEVSGSSSGDEVAWTVGIGSFEELGGRTGGEEARGAVRVKFDTRGALNGGGEDLRSLEENEGLGEVENSSSSSFPPSDRTSSEPTSEMEDVPKCVSRYASMENLGTLLAASSSS